MRNRFITIIVALAATFGMSLATAGSASAEPSGNYEYVCVSTSGSSYSMADGEKLTNCKGSYLQQYINGQQVDTIPLTGDGTRADPDKLDGYCLIGLALDGTLAVVFPPAEAAAVVIEVAAGINTIASCLA